MPSGDQVGAILGGCPWSCRSYDSWMNGERAWGFRTRAIHAGGRPDPMTGARAVPIYQTTSFVFEDTADAADLFALQKFGNIYTRIANPTVAAFEERMASLEGGIGAVATASGQSAEFLVVGALCGAGDHIVSSAQLYGGTRTLLEGTLARFGIETTFVADERAGRRSPRRSARTTKLIYTEVVANPSGAVADLEGLADVAHDAGIPLVVDSTMATPYLCRPIECGADIVVHSATKFLGGHGTSLGGVVVESGRFDWGNGNFPRDDRAGRLLRRAVVVGQLRRVRVLHPAAGRAAARRRPDAVAVQRLPAAAGRRDAAPADGRPPRQHPRRRRVPRGAPRRGVGALGRPARPSATTSGPSATCRTGPARCSSFGVRGGRDAGPHVHRVGRAVQPPRQHRRRPHARDPPGAARPTSSCPTTRSPPPACRPDLVRISVGIEDADDIIWDLDQALSAATKAADR